MEMILTRHSGCLPEDGLHELPGVPQLGPSREVMPKCRRSWHPRDEARIAHHQTLAHSRRAITTKMEKWKCV